MKNHVTINKTFIIAIILFEIIITAIIVYVNVSPKTVTVQVERLENNFSVQKPVLNEPNQPKL